MSDLIDRQLVLDRINKQREHLRPYLYPQDKIGDSAYRICAEFVKRIPSAEPEIIRCKDCKHRDEDECPMRYVEWVTYEEDGYFESDDVVHDRTLDNGFCDRWEKDDTDE